MMLLEEGRGGFSDSGKHREVMTNLFWHGIVPEETPEEKSKRAAAEAAKARSAIGARATPQSALEQMRELQDAIKSRTTPVE